MTELLLALTAINSEHGKGDIKLVTIDMDQSNVHHADNISIIGSVTRRFPGGLQDDERIFRLNGRTLTFIGHRRTMTA